MSKYLNELLQRVKNQRDRSFIAEGVVGDVVGTNGSDYCLYFQVFTINTPNLKKNVFQHVYCTEKVAVY